MKLHTMVFGMLVGASAVCGQSMNLLGVPASGTLAVPVQAGAGDPVAGKLGELRALVARARALAGAGVKPLTVEEGQEWDASSRRAAELVADLGISIPDLKPDLVALGSAKEEIVLAYERLQASRQLVAQALDRAGELDRSAQELAGFSIGPVERRKIGPMNELAAVQLLPEPIVAFMRTGASQRGDAVHRNLAALLQHRVPAIPTSETLDSVEARYASLRTLVAGAKALVPAGGPRSLRRGDPAFETVTRSAATYRSAHPEFVAALDTCLLAQLGHAEERFAREASAALAGVDFEPLLRVPLQVTEIRTLVRVGQETRAQQPRGDTRAFLAPDVRFPEVNVDEYPLDHILPFTLTLAGISLESMQGR